MSIFVRMKRSVIVLALVAGALVAREHAGAAQRRRDTTLGDVTGFTADRRRTRSAAGPRRCGCVFLKDDVFRLWLAPDGNFTDPANTPPRTRTPRRRTSSPRPTTARRRRPGATAAPTTRSRPARSRSGRRSRRCGSRVYRANGQLVWAETAPLSWTDTSTTQSLGRGASEQFFGGGMQNGRFSPPRPDHQDHQATSTGRTAATRTRRRTT